MRRKKVEKGTIDLVEVSEEEAVEFEEGPFLQNKKVAIDAADELAEAILTVLAERHLIVWKKDDNE